MRSSGEKSAKSEDSLALRTEENPLQETENEQVDREDENREGKCHQSQDKGLDREWSGSCFQPCPCS